jgi:hypothetical protein
MKPPELLDALTINATRGLADQLLIIFHDAADIVPVLPNDV